MAERLLKVTLRSNQTNKHKNFKWVPQHVLVDKYEKYYVDTPSYLELQP